MRICNKEVITKIENYINGHKDEILSDLMDIVRIPSVRSEAKEGMPFGEDCHKMLIATKALFEKNGFESKMGKDNAYEVSYYGNKNAKEIGIFSHTDVVPVVASEWILCQPFDPVIKDGYMVGRGCNDDKSGVIEALYIAKMIRDLGLPLKNRLVMVNGGAEETGMEDMEAFSANERMPDASIVPDAEFPCYTGEKSMLQFELVSGKKLEQIKAFNGGLAFNVILEKVDVKLEYNDALYNEILAKCGGNDRFTVTKEDGLICINAKGITRHGAYPEGSLNAAWITAEVLKDCENLCENDRSIMADVYKYLTKYYGEGFGIEHTDANFGKLTSSNGIVRITDDGSLGVMFDVRAGSSCDMYGVVDKVKSVVGNEWKMEKVNVSIGYNIADDNPAKLAVEEVYGELTGQPGIKGKKCSGGTYSRELKNAISLGSVEYRNVKPFSVSLPEGHGGVHQPDETLPIDGFLEALKILTCMILEIDAVL